MKLFGREYKKEEIRQRIGDISQVAGIRSYTLNEGRAQGVNAFDIKTGSGLNFTVLSSRAMDIAWMDHNGRPIGFIKKGGITHPKYHEPYGIEWLRSFNGGVLTTCGLTHVGPPEKDDGWDLGAHGRISNTPAYEVSGKTDWEGDDLVLSVEGKVKEAALFGENLCLSRKITARAGENKIIISDVVENEGYNDTPFMILYHMNLGFPLVSESSYLCAPILCAHPRDEEAQKGLDRFDRFEEPTPMYKEQVFFHKVAADDDGNTCAGIVNESINLGYYIYYNKKELPFLTEWKMMGQQDYVVGLEPGNCVPIGRRATRDKGDLTILKPGDKKSITIEIGILTTWEEIQVYKDYVHRLLKKSK